jgi:hypothetical protein
VVLTVGASNSLTLSYQWYFNSELIPGATSATLSIPNIQSINSGSYTAEVTDSYGGETTSNGATLTVVAASQSIITYQPQSQTIGVGSSVVFSVAVDANLPFFPTYQWQLNGVNLSDGGAISGSAGPQLVITGTSPADEGDYTCVIESQSVRYGDYQSNTASLLVANVSNPGAAVNISSRAFVGTGDNILIGGFYIVGSTSRTVLIQALGPALGGEGVTGVLQHPALTIYDTNGHVVYSNTGWGSSQILLNAAASVYAQPVLQPNSSDSEALLTLPPGGYTAQVSGADGGTGVALCTVYELP